MVNGKKHQPRAFVPSTVSVMPLGDGSGNTRLYIPDRHELGRAAARDAVFAHQLGSRFLDRLPAEDEDLGVIAAEPDGQKLSLAVPESRPLRRRRA